MEHLVFPPFDILAGKTEIILKGSFQRNFRKGAYTWGRTEAACVCPPLKKKTREVLTASQKGWS